MSIPLIKKLKERITNAETAINTKLDKSTIYGGDLNDIDDTCFCYTDKSGNMPIINNGYVFTHKLDNNYLYQRFITYDTLIIFERIKKQGIWGNWELTSTPLTSINPTSILVNGWVENGQNEIFKKDGIVHLTITVRHGTNTTLGTLPVGYRPKNGMLIIATNGVNTGYVEISPTGVITVSSSIFVSGTGNLLFSCSFVAA